MMADVRSTTATASIADTRYSDHDDGADSGLSTVSESTPFLTDHRRPPSAELQTAPSGAQLTDSQRALVTSHQGHDDGGGDQFRISCLSYYDPYHDTSYAAHYLIPLKPLLAGCRPEDVGHVQNPGIPAVVPGAINVSRSPERANGGSGTARSRPSSDLLLGGHFNVYAEPPSLERSASATQIRNATSPSNRDDWLARASREPFYGQEATNEARASSSTCPPNDLSCSGMLSRDPLVAVIQRTLTPNWRVDYVDFTPELSGFETGNISCGESFP
ncbi:hypothetical protein LSH36_473g03026 [Paralvinella palmiformis]|uniref:Uncharacterized protein n=1 Tax=Paralvinella palmiformis TaxID=53620 RepID=A0AAD9JA28_9ANNE|nr:hypothetical protein LSH36_473g03026 [Paralvinella palmiformis]